MLLLKDIILKLDKVIENPNDGVDFNTLEECRDALKDIAEDRNEIHRYEVVATGIVRDINYIKHDDKKIGLIKFLFEKARRQSKGDYIRGKLPCIITEDRAKEKIMNGDKIKIWADLSPYEKTRYDGQRFHSMKLWVDKYERVEKNKNV